MIAIYISTNSFSVVGDKSDTFLPGVRVRVDCGVDGFKYGTVTSRSFNGDITTISFSGDALTSNAADALHGYSEPGSIATHASSHGMSGRDPVSPASIGALPSSGGSLTGAVNCQDNTVQRPHLLDWSETVQALGTITTATAINLESGNVVTATLGSALTFTFSNPPAASRGGGFVLHLTNGGAYTITWPTGIKWPGGVAPTLTAAGLDILVFQTLDGGTTWRGSIAAKDVK